MATATCITSNGVKSVAQSFRAGSGTCITRSGATSAASQVAWAGNTAPKSQVPFLPPIHVDPVLPNGKGGWRWNPDVYRSLRWLYDQFVGGPNGRTVPEVLAELLATQTQLEATTNYAVEVAGYAAAVGDQVSAVVEVTQSNSLSGAAAIPDDPEPPSRYADRYVA